MIKLVALLCLFSMTESECRDHPIKTLLEIDVVEDLAKSKSEELKNRDPMEVCKEVRPRFELLYSIIPEETDYTTYALVECIEEE